MDVHPLRVGLTTSPGNDVGCPQQGAIGDTRDRTSVLPIGQKCLAKNTLADPDPFDAFDLGVSKSGSLALELLQRQGRKADRFAVYFADHFKQRISRGKREGCDVTFCAGLSWLRCEFACHS